MLSSETYAQWQANPAATQEVSDNNNSRMLAIDELSDFELCGVHRIGCNHKPASFTMNILHLQFLL